MASQSQAQYLVSHEKAFKLIELIQAEACMWDMYDSSYHDRNKKRRVVDDIANSLELSGKFLEIIRPKPGEGRTFSGCQTSCIRL